MSDPARYILTAGMAACCLLLWLGVLTALTAQPYCAATFGLFRQAKALESAASVVLFCSIFLSAFAEERLKKP